MFKWAHVLWAFLHSQSFFIDLHESRSIEVQRSFVTLIQELPKLLQCVDCRKHLRAFLLAYPPPEPTAYEPEDYVYARYVWSIHNSVNRRTHKPIVNFEDVVDVYVNEAHDAVCTASPDTVPPSSDQKQGSENNTAVSIVVAVSGVAIIVVIIICACLQARARR